VKVVEVARVLTPDEATEYVGEKPPDLPPTAIEPGTIVRDAESGDAILMYVPLENPAPFRQAIMTVDCRGGVQRTQNYRSRSRTFGYAPRRPVMGREACSLTSLATDQPKVAALLEAYADQFSAVLTENLPAVAQNTNEALSEVLPEWRMGNSHLWTSGVINDTAALPYHRDAPPRCRTTATCSTSRCGRRCRSCVAGRAAGTCTSPSTGSSRRAGMRR